MVDGGAGSDNLVVEGTAGVDTFVYTPDGTNDLAGQVLFNTNVTINFDHTEGLTIAGLADDDSLTANGLAGDDLITLDALAGDSGVIQVNDSSRLTFRDIETRTIDSHEGLDRLTVNTSALNNVVLVVAATATITVDGRSHDLHTRRCRARHANDQHGRGE